MADRFPFMRVYKEMADALPKEDRADFYDALIEYALDDKEPEPSTGAAVFQAARRMVDKWKQTSAAGKARAEKSKTAGRSLDGRWTVAGSEKPAKEEKKKSIKDKKNKEKDISLSRYMEKEKRPEAEASSEVRAEDVVELYNIICVSLPKVTKITDARRKSIQARLKENDPQDFRKVFEKAEASDFLSGRSGKWQMCTFDWIVGSPSHWQRIIEGVYDNRERSRPNAADSLRDKLNVNDEDRERAARLG